MGGLQQNQKVSVIAMDFIDDGNHKKVSKVSCVEKREKSEPGK